MIEHNGEVTPEKNICVYELVHDIVVSQKSRSTIVSITVTVPA